MYVIGWIRSGDLIVLTLTCMFVQYKSQPTWQASLLCVLACHSLATRKILSSWLWVSCIVHVHVWALRPLHWLVFNALVRPLVFRRQLFWVADQADATLCWYCQIWLKQLLAVYAFGSVHSEFCLYTWQFLLESHSLLDHSDKQCLYVGHALVLIWSLCWLSWVRVSVTYSIQVNAIFTHTVHSHSLSLSLTHTHTHTHSHRCICTKTRSN